MKEAINFTPPGMIPEFNAWGNHPISMPKHMKNQMLPCFSKLRIEENYPEMEEIILKVISELATRSNEFTGYHEPKGPILDIFSKFEKNFVLTKECEFYGKENYEIVLKLLKNGCNVLMIENHMSPVDAFVPFSLIKQKFGAGIQLPAVVMSQVFEYSRMISILSSCIRKYPVFQPKHMRKMAEEGHLTAVQKMKEQNLITLECITKKAENGGEIILLYPERDRNAVEMGVPEPKAMKIVNLLASLAPKLYILPTFVNGLETIYPNNPGPYELDNFFQNVQIGSGKFYCGQPIEFATILNQLKNIPDEYKNLWIKTVFGDTPIKDEDRANAVLSIFLLRIISELAPDKKGAGVYADLILP